MAKHDDHNLIRLFKLKSTEARSLGLKAIPDQASETDVLPNAEHGESAALAASSSPLLPSSAEDVKASDELALLSLLDGGSVPDEEYNGYGATHGLALAGLDSGPSSTLPPPPPNAVPSEPAQNAVPEILFTETDDHVDLVHLFGLTSEEATGLGLPAEESHVSTTLPDAPVEMAVHIEEPTPQKKSLSFTAKPIPPIVSALPLLLNDSIPEPRIEEPAISAISPENHFSDPALLEAFAEESAELLDSLHVELEHLENNLADRGALLEIRRAVHTLKGGAKMCGFELVVTLTHSCENLLDLLADGAISLTPPILHALFSSEPLLRATVQDALLGTKGSDTKLLMRLAAQFDTLASTDQNHEIMERATPVEMAEDIPAVVGTSETEASPLAFQDEILSEVEEDSIAVPLLQETISSDDAVIEPQVRSSSRRSSNTLNVDLSKVDAVVAKASELAAQRASYQAMIKQLLDATEEARRNAGRLQNLTVHLGNEHATIQSHLHAQASTSGQSLDPSIINSLMLQLQEAVNDQQALIQHVHDTITMHWRLRSTESRADADLQSALMNIRLIPISNMRVRLDGVVRQTAQATGKGVRWQLLGGNVAVEKNVFDRLFEPLMHLIRNSIDHGLEESMARQSIGKPEVGNLTVTARQENNQIVIAVADDGKGIIPNKIAAAAIDRGLITVEQAETMTFAQKTQLIFMPGFSTAGSISHVSGRGVGMDAVHDACLRMGGTVDISSEPGVGTTVTMRLPLSLSVTRGLIIRDSGHLLAIPVAQITALHLVSLSDIVETPEGHVARLEGIDLPIFMMPPLVGTTPPPYVQNEEIHVLQVPYDRKAVGIIIEEVLEEEEILIKAAPTLLRNVKTILGSHMLPGGTVAPVLNLPQVLPTLQPVTCLAAPEEKREEGELIALVVDDSMSMRVAISSTLENAGFRVLTARDGQEALDVLQREGLPRLITLDVEMPRMDGLETLFAIRHLPGAHKLPVFMMTSRGGASHRRAAEQLGATRYFTKPYRDSELLAAARTACKIAS